MGEFGTIVALGSLGLSALALLMRAMDKGLSRGEHAEFKDAVEREIERVNRRLERLEGK